MFSAGLFDSIFGVTLYDGEQLSVDGQFEIVYTRRTPGNTVDISGLILDFIVGAGAIIKILKNGVEVRKYGHQDEAL